MSSLAYLFVVQHVARSDAAVLADRRTMNGARITAAKEALAAAERKKDAQSVLESHLGDTPTSRAVLGRDVEFTRLHFATLSARAQRESQVNNILHLPPSSSDQRLQNEIHETCARNVEARRLLRHPPLLASDHILRSIAARQIWIEDQAIIRLQNELVRHGSVYDSYADHGTAEMILEEIEVAHLSPSGVAERDHCAVRAALLANAYSRFQHFVLGRQLGDADTQKIKLAAGWSEQAVKAKAGSSGWVQSR